MIVNKAYKLRIYPNKEQEILIAKTIGCSRFVFNRFLTQHNPKFFRAVEKFSNGTTHSFQT